MTNLDVVNKLIGNIKPSGSSEIDECRLENLKEMCDLTKKLITQILDVYVDNMESKMGSVKKCSDLSKDFLFNYLGLNPTKDKNEKFIRKSKPMYNNDVVCPRQKASIT